ncbi:MAG: DNA-3-methyladenine glycosylase family protein [Candidatus Limimorpha sp.]
MEQLFFKYGQTEIDYLKKKDKRLAAIIDKVGMIQRECNPDLFSALVEATVGQQISTKAQQTICKRMRDTLKDITPEKLDGLPLENIQQFGITFKKAGYIKSIARKVCNGELDIDGLSKLSDEEVCQRLTALDGIGVWTAEMLMIFSMQRPDILSYKDLAIIRGMKMLYHHNDMPKARFERYRRRYSPYCTVASLYLWKVAGGQCEVK